MLHLLAPYFRVAPWIWIMLLIKMSRRGYGSMFRNVEVIDFHTASAASATVLQFKYQELSYPPNWQRSSASTSLPMTIGNYTRLFTNYTHILPIIALVSRCSDTWANLVIGSDAQPDDQQTNQQVVRLTYWVIKLHAKEENLKKKFMTLSSLSLLSIAQSFSTNLHQIWQFHAKLSLILLQWQEF